MFNLLDGGIIGNIIWVVMFMVMIFFYPRLMIMQMMYKLEQSASMLEGLTNKARHVVTKKISKKPSHDLNEKVSNFMEFFSIDPVNLDPVGIVKKLEHIQILSENRFEYFVRKTSPKMDAEAQANIMMGLAGAISLNQISKVVRHFVEMVRKTKSLQIAMLLQMQLPLIEQISKALLKGTEAFTNGWPVGDSVGGIVVAKMAGNSKTKEIEKDTVVTRKKIRGKNVILMKAKGPGSRLGRLGRAVEKLSKREKISKIITVDAAAKLEGEKTGRIAEGIGVAIGGIGIDRSYIENLATTRNLPLDTFVVKMSQEEAIMPMVGDVLKSVDKMITMVENNIAETKEKGTIVVVGVGNTVGVGNDRKSSESAEKKVKEVIEIMKKREQSEKPKRNWFSFGF
ncbi:MAG: DUF1512 family protein [Candidatus Aenigmarchaeota archaeon]|nr:DUF1512 family protein [Candidatus Aenigmarchaeota archaeon]